HDPKQRRLARAVQAEHADLRAGEEAQADVAQDVALRRNDLADAVHREDVLGHGSRAVRAGQRLSTPREGRATVARHGYTTEPNALALRSSTYARANFSAVSGSGGGPRRSDIAWLISSRLLTRGNGASGTGTPRKAHNGFQPSFGEKTSSRSDGSESMTA